MTVHAFCIGEPVTVGANIVSRRMSRGSSRLRPRRTYSVWVRRDISFRCGPVMRPPSEQTALIILSSSSTTMKSSSVSFVDSRNSVSVSAVAPPAGWRNVPEIGFIVTMPSRALTCASGLAPTATWPGVTMAKVQYAPRSCSSSARNQVSAAVGGIRVHSRGEVAPDDEVRALAAVRSRRR